MKRKFFLFTLFGNGAHALSQWLVVVLLARWAGVQELGQYAFFLSVFAPLVLMFNSGLRSVCCSDVNNEFSTESYFYYRVLTVVCFCLIGGGVSVFYPDERLLIVSILLIKSIESIADLCYGVYQAAGDQYYIFRSLLIRSVCFICTVFLYLYYNSDFVMALLVGACCFAFVVYFLDVRPMLTRFKFSGFSACAEVIPAIFKSTYMLGLVALIVSINWNVPRYFLERNFGFEMVGYYSAILYFVVMGNMVINSLCQAVFREMSERYRNSDGYYLFVARLMLGVFVFGLTFMLVSYFFGADILHMFYGEKFRQYGYLMFLMSIFSIIIFCSSVLGHALTATRVYSGFIPSYLFVFFGTIVFAFTVFPGQGIYASVYTLIAFSVFDFISKSILFIRMMK